MMNYKNIPFIPNKKKKITLQRPPAAPLLVSAVLDRVASTVLLTFDQPMNWGGFDGAQIEMNDVVTGKKYLGLGGCVQTGPELILVTFEIIGTYEGTETVINATAGTGLVSDITFIAWAGVENWPL